MPAPQLDPPPSPDSGMASWLAWAGLVLAWLTSHVGPAVRRAVPRLFGALTSARERSATASKLESEAEKLKAEASKIKAEAGAIETEAEDAHTAADLALVAHYEKALAKAEEREAARDAREAARERALAELAGLEAECRELHRQATARAALTEAALHRQEGQVRELLRTVTTLAVRVGGTPPAGHSTITAPLDPLADPRDSRADPAGATTPPAGHRLTPIPAPAGIEPDPHESKTPR